MTKSIILRANLSIQNHNIICIPRTGLEQVIQRLAIRINGRDESVEIHAAQSISTSFPYFV
jgi:hypothetical protein